MQSLTATAAKPPDELDAVLGRFEAWSASRKKTEKTPPKTTGFPDGVRELSYEEALETSRNRWQTRLQPSVTNARTEEIQAAAEEKPAPALTPAGQHDKPAPEALPATTFNYDAIQPDKLSLSTAASQPAHQMNPSGKPVTPAFGTVLAQALPAEPDPNPDLGPLALVWPAPPKNERQVSMSLRVAASEQALIKARAAEAGLSVSAYLRQCALEVEKLRAQVHHTLALLEQKSQQRSEQSPPRSLTAGSAQSPVGGFFARVGQLLFGNPARLTLRA